MEACDKAGIILDIDQLTGTENLKPALVGIAHQEERNAVVGLYIADTEIPLVPAEIGIGKPLCIKPFEKSRWIPC